MNLPDNAHPSLRPPLGSGAMATTEEARPGLVLPEYGPTGPELVRGRLGRRGGASSWRWRRSWSWPSRC